MLAAAAAEARRFPARPDAVPEMDRWIEFVGERWGSTLVRSSALEFA